MTLKELQTEMISAMKNKDKFRKETISSLVQAVKKYAIDNGLDRENPSEETVTSVLLKEQKTIQEMIDTCPASRPEMLEEYKKKMSIINEYAPHLITDEVEINAAIVLLCKENSIDLEKKNRGLIMKTIMPTMKGIYDMSVVNKCVGGLLK